MAQVGPTSARRPSSLQEHACVREGPAWVAAAESGPALIVVRAGGWFRRSRREDPYVLDAARIAVEMPGDGSETGHLDGATDLYDRLSLANSQALALVRALPALRSGPLEVSVGFVLEYARVTFPIRRHACGIGQSPADVLVDSLVRDGSDSAPRARAPLAEAIRARMAVGGAQPIARLAAAVGSRSHVSRSFARATGATLAQHRARLRVCEAIHALAATDASAGQIAAAVGFADHPHMTRSIKAATGCTPAQLRDHWS